MLQYLVKKIYLAYNMHTTYDMQIILLNISISFYLTCFDKQSLFAITFRMLEIGSSVYVAPGMGVGAGAGTATWSQNNMLRTVDYFLFKYSELNMSLDISLFICLYLEVFYFQIKHFAYHQKQATDWKAKTM